MIQVKIVLGLYLVLLGELVSESVSYIHEQLFIRNIVQAYDSALSLYITILESA